MNKTPYFLVGALNAIHFPSLRRIHLDFSAVRNGWSDEDDVMRHQESRVQAALMCFPIFVAFIADAKNLESL